MKSDRSGLKRDCGGAEFSPVLTQEQLWLAEELHQVCLFLKSPF